MGLIGDRMRQDLALAGYAPTTRRMYWSDARALVARFRRPPTESGRVELRQYVKELLALAVGSDRQRLATLATRDRYPHGATSCAQRAAPGFVQPSRPSPPQHAEREPPAARRAPQPRTTKKERRGFPRHSPPPRSAVPVRAQFRIRGTSSTRRVGRLHSQPGYDFLLSHEVVARGRQDVRVPRWASSRAGLPGLAWPSSRGTRRCRRGVRGGARARRPAG